MATSDGRTATGGPSGSLKGDFIVRDTADPTGRQLYRKGRWCVSRIEYNHQQLGARYATGPRRRPGGK